MAMLLNEVTKKIAESNRTVHHLHAEAPRAEATPVVPEAPEAPEASEAPVAVEPSAPPARGHSRAGGSKIRSPSINRDHWYLSIPLGVKNCNK